MEPTGETLSGLHTQRRVERWIDVKQSLGETNTPPQTKEAEGHSTVQRY